MIHYELVDHTADIGIIAQGKDLKALFLNCALAMFDVIAEAPASFKGLEAKKCPINISATDIKELLVLWLSELLSLSDCEDVFFADFDIRSISENKIQAQALGFSRRNFIGKREVKAVTYHGLEIQKSGKGLKAQVIFDV